MTGVPAPPRVCARRMADRPLLAYRAQVTIGVIVVALVLASDLRGVIGFSSFTVLVYYAIANASAWTLGRTRAAGRRARAGGVRRARAEPPLDERGRRRRRARRRRARAPGQDWNQLPLTSQPHQTYISLGTSILTSTSRVPALRGRRVSGVAATGLGRDGSRAYARSARSRSGLGAGGMLVVTTKQVCRESPVFERVAIDRCRVAAL